MRLIWPWSEQDVDPKICSIRKINWTENCIRKKIEERVQSRLWSAIKMLHFNKSIPGEKLLSLAFKRSLWSWSCFWSSPKTSRFFKLKLNLKFLFWATYFPGFKTLKYGERSLNMSYEVLLIKKANLIWLSFRCFSRFEISRNSNLDTKFESFG